MLKKFIQKWLGIEPQPSVETVPVPKEELYRAYLWMALEDGFPAVTAESLATKLAFYPANRLSLNQRERRREYSSRVATA